MDDTTPTTESAPETPIASEPVETADHTPVVGTPTENRAGANQQTLTVELEGGEKITAVRWFNVVEKIWEYQTDIDGKIYDLKETEDGKYIIL